MYFSQEDIQKLWSGYSEIEEEYNSTMLKYGSRKFKQQQAAEFAMHGFVRRIKTLKRCIENIYKLCPPEIDRKPSVDEITDTTINLHAFYINAYGALDNLAWVWVHETSLKDTDGNPLKNNQIGMAKKNKIVWNSFSKDFQKYLSSREKWLSHIEDFRHSLAHRIPLYVPPYVCNPEETEQERNLEKQSLDALRQHNFKEYELLSDEIKKIGRFVPWMTHSFSEKSPQAVFHAQLLADWKTIYEISQNFLSDLEKQSARDV